LCQRYQENMRWHSARRRRDQGLHKIALGRPIAHLPRPSPHRSSDRKGVHERRCEFLCRYCAWHRRYQVVHKVAYYRGERFLQGRDVPSRGGQEIFCRWGSLEIVVSEQNGKRAETVQRLEVCVRWPRDYPSAASFGQPRSKGPLSSFAFDCPPPAIHADTNAPDSDMEVSPQGCSCRYEALLPFCVAGRDCKLARLVSPPGPTGGASSENVP